MSSTRVHGLVVFECDECGEIFEPKTSDFEEAIQILKEEDWVVFKLDDSWQHTCADCKGGYTV